MNSGILRLVKMGLFQGVLSTVLVACITVTGSVIIIVVKHTIETHYLSLEEMGNGHEQKKWLHTNRAFSNDCYHSFIDGDIDANPTESQRAGPAGGLSEQSKANRLGM